MAAHSIEAEVIDLIAHERGLPRRKVILSSRLLHDLGMDGDDAVEFFQDFEKRYGPDLAPLYRHWDRHFGPEGFGSPMMFLILLALVFLPIPLIPLGISPEWVWGIEIGAILLWLWPLRQWPLKDKTIAVTVEDVVMAAKTKQWPIAYEEVP
jgi:acyl carrier protein